MLPTFAVAAGSALAAITGIKVWAEQKRLRAPITEPLIEQLTGDRPSAKNGVAPTLLPVVSDLVDAVADLVKRPLAQGNHALQVFRDETLPVLQSAAVALDERYQQLMVDYFDPLFGRARSAQMQALMSESVTLYLSEAEKQINRQIAYSLLGLGAMVTTLWLYAPALWLFALPMLYMNSHVYKRAYQVLKAGQINYYVLMVFSFTGLVLGGYFVAGMVSAVTYNVIEKLLAITQDRSYHGLANIFGQQVRTVWLATAEGLEVEVPFAQVQAGDTVVVSAGQMAPVDGQVVRGLATVDQHTLTGEAQPVEKAPGDRLYAATMVLAGKLYVQVEKTGEATVAAQIGAMLNRTASYQMSASIKSIEIAHRTALPVLVTGGIASLLIGLEQGVAVTASGLGTNVRPTAPIAMLNFLNIASRKGILIKDARSLELLHEVDTVLFDKTGTLTLEQPQVIQIHLCADAAIAPETLLRYAAAAEQRQSHPIARAILQAAMERNLTLPALDDARYEVGYGLKVLLDGHTIRVGSERFITAEGIVVPAAIQTQQSVSHQMGHSLVMVAIDDQLGGAIELQPTLRPETKAVVDALHARGLTLAIISGDQEAPTRQLAQSLGIDRYFANTLPENKAALVEQLQQEGHAVCFVGDGINDAIALKKANVSVSLRGATTVATDTAQIVLIDHGLRQLIELFTLADEFNRNMRANLIAALAPGLLNIAGIFVLHWGLYTTIALTNLGLLNNLRIAMLPLLRHRKDDPSQ